MASNNNPQPNQQYEEQKKSQFLSGMLDAINPFSGGFGIGSIFKTLLVVTGVYFLMRNETVQNFVGKLFGEDGPEKVKSFIDGISAKLGGLLPEGIADKLGLSGTAGTYLESRSDDQLRELLGKSLSPEMTDIIVSERKAFFETVKEANGGKINGESDLTNDNAIFALITKQPALTKKLLGAMNGSTTGGDSKTRDAMYASLRKIVADDRLDVLLSSTHRATTLELVGTMLGTNTAGLEAKLAPMLADANGKQMLRALLTEMLTPGNDGDMGKAMGNVLHGSNVPAGVKDKALETLLANPAELVGDANLTGFATLRKALGDAKLKEFLQLATNPELDDAARSQAVQAFVMKKEHLPAFKTFADGICQLDSLPKAEMRAPIAALKGIDAGALPTISTIAANGVDPQQLQGIFRNPNAKPDAGYDVKYIINQLLVSENRDLIRKAGTGNVIALANGGTPAATTPNPMHSMLTAGNWSWNAFATPQPPSPLFGIHQFLPQAPAGNGILTQGNLDVLLKAIDRLDNRTQALTAEYQNDTPAAGASQVLSAFMAMADGNKEPLRKLKPETVAWFFNDPEYRGALEGLIKGLKIPAGAPGGQLFASLQQNWGTIEASPEKKRKEDKNGWGLVEVFSSAHAVKEMQTYFMKDDQGFWNNVWGRLNITASSADPSKLKLIENLDLLKTFKESLPEPTPVATGTSVSPTATASKSSGFSMSFPRG